MALPFTVAQFFDVLQGYNESFWPMQIILVLIGIAAFVLVFRKTTASSRIIAGALAFLWLWTGIAYHLVFFTGINKAAYGFGALFIIQAVLFLIAGFRDKLAFSYRKDWYGYLGVFFAVFGLAIYPLLNYVFGHWWPLNPTFGLPCPTTIFTFGMLLLTVRKVPKHLLVIPVIWALIGVNAAFFLGVWEDLMLIISAVAGTVLLFVRDKKS